MKKKLHIILPFILLSCCILSTIILKIGNIKSNSSKINNQLNQATSTVVNNNVTYISPYTGENISKNVFENIPFMAMIENSSAARPQSGLSEADIVYETMAEGGIPRFIALFHSASPKIIGPIRSVRPYFITISKEYNLPFAHCGGSPQAIETINQNKLMSMNEINHGNYYWRDKTRTAPHNLYTSADKLRNLITISNFSQKASSNLKFDKKYWDTNFPTATYLNMTLNRYYSTSYEFENGFYYKSMDNVEAIDKGNDNKIAIKNVVIQTTNIETQNDGRLIINQIGTGTGYVLSNGKYIKINWKKSDENSPTSLFNEDGTIVKLSPGKTWWHIVDNKCKFEFQ